MVFSIHHDYSSCYPQYNLTFEFEGKIYQVDEKTLRTVQSIFDLILCTSLSSSGQRSASLSRLKAERVLTRSTFESILHFFHRGQLQKTTQVKDLQALEIPCEYYTLPLLRNCLYQAFQAESFDLDLLNEESIASPFDRLELAALQQQTALFRDIFSRLMQNRWALKESQRWALSEEKEIGKMMIHFDPESFNELMSHFIRPNWPSLYAKLLRTYVQFYQHRLVDILPLLTDVQLRWDCLAEWALFDEKILWFKQLAGTIPSKLIKKAVIYPLIEESRLKEAREWAIQVQEHRLAVDLLEKARKYELAKKVQALFTSQMQTFDKRLPLLADPRENGFARFPLISKVAYENPPSVAIQKAVAIYIQSLMSNNRVMEPSFRGVSLVDFLKQEVLTISELEWSENLLLVFIRQYVRTSLEMLCESTYRDLQRAHCELTEHDSLLHPSLMEDLAILQTAAEDFYSDLQQHFTRSQMADNALLKRVLSEKLVLDEVLSAARYLYQQRFSLKTDFIVQATSNYLHAYIVKQKTSMSAKPFAYQLEGSLQKADLGLKLEPKDILFTIHIYVRKGVEAANYRLSPLGERKLNPNCLNHVQSLLKAKEAIKEALQRDFPSDYLLQLPPDQAKRMSGAYLTRLVFLEALKAYYRTFPSQPRVYPKYFPPKKPYFHPLFTFEGK